MSKFLYFGSSYFYVAEEHIGLESFCLKQKFSCDFLLAAHELYQITYC